MIPRAGGTRRAQAVAVAEALWQPSEFLNNCAFINSDGYQNRLRYRFAHASHPTATSQNLLLQNSFWGWGQRGFSRVERVERVEGAARDLGKWLGPQAIKKLCFSAPLLLCVKEYRVGRGGVGFQRRESREAEAQRVLGVGAGEASSNQQPTASERGDLRLATGDGRLDWRRVDMSTRRCSKSQVECRQVDSEGGPPAQKERRRGAVATQKTTRAARLRGPRL